MVIKYMVTDYIFIYNQLLQRFCITIHTIIQTFRKNTNNSLSLSWINAKDQRDESLCFSCLFFASIRYFGILGAVYQHSSRRCSDGVNPLAIQTKTRKGIFIFVFMVLSYRSDPGLSFCLYGIRATFYLDKTYLRFLVF